MYTFDVFDTLITRKTAEPTGIFALMQQKLLQCEEYSSISDYVKNNFYYLRINSEMLARRTYNTVKGAEDVTLEQIYEAMAMTGSLTTEEIQKLMDLERLTEYENVVGIKKNIDKLKALITKGEHVALISDMYLERKTIKKMLIKENQIFNNINLYVSSEDQKGKYTGSLYELVKEKEDADYGYWTHCGNDHYSDVKFAQKHGIKAEHFNFEPLMACEKKILDKKADDSFMQLTIGTARNTRLQYSLTGAAAIGCSLGGPILFPYVWWIIQESIRKGIKRLYFIARDGFVLKKIADNIIKNFNYNIKTSYIYGSRKAWRMPAFSENNNDIYKLMRWSHASKIQDMRTLSNLFELPLEQFLRFVPKEYQNADMKLTQFRLAELVKKLNSNRVFKEHLYETHKEKRKVVVKYLQQEIDVKDDDFAFVELAGGGFTQGCLAEIMSDFYHKQIRTFFLKLDEMNVMTNCTYYNFLPSFLYLSFIVEMLCRAPHGQTMGYHEENGKIIPKIKDDEGDALVQHGFYEYLMGVEKFTENYSSVVKEVNINAYNLDLLLQYIEYITKTPDKDILEFFAAMPFGGSGREEEVIEFAPMLTKREIRSIFLWRTNEPMENYYKGSSLEYSILRCSEKDRRKIDLYKNHSNLFLGKLVRILKKVIKPESKHNLAADFPCDYIGEKVVLYAAGKFGKDLYRKINSSGKSRVVLWVDKDYEKYRKMGLKVSDPRDIGRVDYDDVVIAVLDKKLAESISKILVEQGVPREKIIWINLRPSWV